MKRFNRSYFKCFIPLLLWSLSQYTLLAQVGIGTATPNGILDVTSTNQGIVLPKLLLTDTYIAAPAKNPKTGLNNILTGTVVYNTNTTNRGAISGVSDDVFPGLYYWNGTKWISQFTRKQYSLFEQSTLNLSTRFNVAKLIPGINNEQFTASYTGKYKVELNVNYGGGQAEDPIFTGSPASRSDGAFNIGRQGGNFQFSMDGGTTNYTLLTQTFSTANLGSNGNSGNNSGNYFGVWKQWTKVYYVNLKRGDVLNLRLNFTQAASPEFIGLGNNNLLDGAFTGGNGHIGFDIPCTVEISFIDEQ